MGATFVTASSKNVNVSLLSIFIVRGTFRNLKKLHYFAFNTSFKYAHIPEWFHSTIKYAQFSRSFHLIFGHDTNNNDLCYTIIVAIDNVKSGPLSLSGITTYVPRMTYQYIPFTMHLQGNINNISKLIVIKLPVHFCLFFYKTSCNI